MKTTKLFIFSVLAILFAACNTQEPVPSNLIGAWSEPYHVNIYVKSFVFHEDGSLDYKRVPDTTWILVIDEAGEFGKLNYKIKNNQLYFYGTGLKFNDDIRKYEDVPFEFTTDFSLEGDTLKIDSFSCDGGLQSRFYKSIQLYKQ